MYSVLCLPLKELIEVLERSKLLPKSVTQTDARRVYVESGAGPGVFEQLERLKRAGRVFDTVHELVEEIRRGHLQAVEERREMRAKVALFSEVLQRFNAASSAATR